MKTIIRSVILIRTLWLGILTVSGLYGQAVSLAGRITEPSGAIIAGAQVRLQQKGLSAESNGEGIYSFSATGARAPDYDGRPVPYRISGNRISLHLDHDEKVSASLFDLDGRRSLVLFSGGLLSGRHEIPVGGQRISGIRMLSLRIGSREYLHPVFFLPSGNVFLSPEGIAPNGEPLHSANAKSAAFVALDTLEVGAIGYLPRKVPVDRWQGNLDVVLTKPYTGRRPNVLLLYSDQHQGAALGAEGHPDILTPNLDRMAGEGVRFTRAYVQDGVCESSRNSLMTGLYPRTLGMLDNGDRTQASRNATSLAATFHAAGYQTATFGKRHLVGVIDSGWDIHRDDLYTSAGLQDKENSYVGWLVGQGKNPANGEPYIREFAWDWGAEFDNGPPGGETGPFGDFGTKYLDPPARNLATLPTTLPESHTMEAFVADNTINFLKTRDKSRPFFCWASFYRPHQPYNPIQRYLDKYDSAVSGWSSAWGSGRLQGGKIKKPSNLSQAAAGLPPFLANWRNSRSKPWNLKDAAENEQLYRDYLSAYYALVTEVDKHIGDILVTLDQLGLSENTIVVYSSDHGDFVGRHGMVEKAQVGHAVYEETYRVPFLMRWKNQFVPGQTQDGLVEVLDLFPTLLDLTGVKKISDGFTLGGVSLAPALNRGVKQGKPFIVVENWSAQSVFTTDYKLSRWITGADLKAGKPDYSKFGDMLFDRSFDPGEGAAFPSETVNRIAEPGMNSVRLDLEKKLSAWLASTPDQGRKESFP